MQATFLWFARSSVEVGEAEKKNSYGHVTTAGVLWENRPIFGGQIVTTLGCLVASMIT